MLAKIGEHRIIKLNVAPYHGPGIILNGIIDIADNLIAPEGLTELTLVPQYRENFG